MPLWTAHGILTVTAELQVTAHILHEEVFVSVQAVDEQGVEDAAGIVHITGMDIAVAIGEFPLSFDAVDLHGHGSAAVLPDRFVSRLGEAAEITA